jgi:hypothetical protein
MLLQHDCLVSVAAEEALKSKFDRIRERYFQALATNNETILFYFTGEPPDMTNKQSLLEDANVPVYLRLEISIRHKEESVDFDASNDDAAERWVTIPLSTLPTSYIFAHGNAFRNLSLSDLDQISSPLEIPNGQTCYLRFVYCVLSHRSDLVEASATDEGMPLRLPHFLLQLPLSKRQLIADMEAQFEGLLKEELMNHLTLWQPRTENIQDLALAILVQNSHILRHTRVVEIELNFIRPEMGIETFLEMLQSNETLGGLTLKSIGRYFCLNSEVLDSWLFFIVDRALVTLYSHTNGAKDMQATIVDVSNSLRSMVKKVNQVSLLQELNETRICRFVHLLLFIVYLFVVASILLRQAKPKLTLMTKSLMNRTPLKPFKHSYHLALFNVIYLVAGAFHSIGDFGLARFLAFSAQMYYILYRYQIENTYLCTLLAEMYFT